MSSDPQPTVALEPIYVIEAIYAPDAAETRQPIRPQHLARIAELRERGIVIEAGGYADVSASLILVRAASEEDALEIARDDVYMKNGVWVELRVKKFGRVVRPSELPAPSGS